MTSDGTQIKAALIRLRQVMARTGMSRSTIYAYIKDGRFPPPIAISERCVAWVEIDIDRWIEDRIASGRRV